MERYNQPKTRKVRSLMSGEDCVLPKTKMVENLMTGEIIEIPRNTPIYLDPSRETYWQRIWHK